MVTTLALSFADDHLERVVLGTAPDLDHWPAPGSEDTELGWCERLMAGKHMPERCLEAVFRFLLDHKPKESILGRFDVTAILRYFPEFEREMPRYLSQL